MSETISNVRNVPTTRPVARIRRPGKDERSQDEGTDRNKPGGGAEDGETVDAVADEDKPLLDEYA